MYLIYCQLNIQMEYQLLIQQQKQIMQKIISSIPKTSFKNLISFQDFKTIRKNQNNVLIVQIGKQPSTLLKNSLWVGYRNGGMASWLTSLMPHLPHQKFCLYMDEDSYKGSQYMYAYYSQYFSKLFHKQYLGTFVHSRRNICSKQMINLNEVKAIDIDNRIKCEKSHNSPLVLLDLRNSQIATRNCLTKEVSQYKNTHYINVPLNDDDFLQVLHSKTDHLPQNTRFITMCAKGYRSIIGYSMLELIKKPQWNIHVCRNPLQQIKQELAKAQKVTKKQAQIKFSQLSMANLAFN